MSDAARLEHGDSTSDAGDRRALLQGALRALDDMQAKLDQAEAARREPIAIVGMGCRLPGGVTTPEEYWQLLVEGRDVVGTFPDDRRALAEAVGIDVEAVSDGSTWYGGFLEGLDQFDPAFFGISPREATSMDPQQRLVLEVTWEALERAAIAPDSLNGSATGVFIGITSSDYVQLAKLHGPAEMDVYTATGGALNAAAGRVAFTLGLQGPAMAIDTACSSSLVAVHQACQSLRTGESDMAIAGGVNVVLMPEAFVCFTRWGMMAPDGRCKTFDAAADGFVRSEGCGIVVLKRLSDALAEGDPILAVIRGSAVNQDGRSSGLTVPNGLAQQEVLVKALDAAGVAPADVQYVEAHGTGTTLGDPIEVEALGAVLGRGRGPDDALVLGSVKTNLGHLESAAGIAGLLKVVLSMQHGQVPPHLHFHEPSPSIPWPAFPVEVRTQLTDWPARDGRRLAGVSGFGFSGTNAHVVLESVPAVPAVAAAAVEREPGPPQLLGLSAKSEPALQAFAGRIADHVRDRPQLRLADLCYSAGAGRAHHGQRLAIVAESPEQLVERLDAFSTGTATTVHQGVAGRPRIGFLFTGQGSQYGGMAADLHATQPVFRGAFDRCAAIVDPLLDVPLAEVVFASNEHPDPLINQTRYTQPALFAVEYGLAELWRSWGVTPYAVLGHSVGEYAAAVVAGACSLEDGLTLLAARARLMQSLPAGGSMAALFAPEAEVAAAVAPHAARLSVAAVNGPAHTVISGDAELVERVAAEFSERGVRVQPLTVSHAFHSPLMSPILDEFRGEASGVAFGRPRIRMATNADGRLAADELIGPDYWVRQISAPVAFSAGLDTLRSLGCDTLVEIGPHPVLAGLAQAAGVGERWLPSLRRGRTSGTQILDSAGALYVAGATLDWDKLVPSEHRRVALPTYPFQRRRYWIDPPRRRTDRPAGSHPLLGRRTRSPLLAETIHESIVDTTSPGWISDHRLHGDAVFPGTAFVEIALAAGADGEPCTVDSLTISDPLVLPDGEEVTLQTVVSGDELRTVEVVSQPGGPGSQDWQRHATAAVRTTVDPAPADVDPEALTAGCATEIDVADYYAGLREIGLDYGPTFRGLRRLLAHDRRAVGFVELPAEVADGGAYALHPALLDACFHVIGAAIAASPELAVDDFFVPVAVEGLALHRAGSTAVWCVAELLEAGADGATAAVTLTLYDAGGSAVAEISRLTLRRAPRGALRRSGRAADGIDYVVEWRPAEPPEASAPAGEWLVLADRTGVADALVDALAASGARCTVAVSSQRSAELDGGRWELDWHDPAAVSALVTACSKRSTLTGVVSLLALDAVEATFDAEQIERGQIAALRGSLHLTQALAAVPSPPRLWIVTRGAQSVEGEPCHPLQAAAWGLARVVANEAPALRCTAIDLDPAASSDVAAALAGELAGAGADDDQIALRGDRRFVARLVPHVPSPAVGVDGPYRLTISERGSLDNCGFEALERRSPAAGEIEIEVRATGLNFRDVLNVLGMMPGDPGLPGLECAGVVTAVGQGVERLAVGEAVVAIAPNAFDSHVVTDAALAVRVPDTITLAEAATLPIAYLTAAYGLRHLANLRAGERVLIHAAAGGVGVAAVRIAQQLGAEVFATVGSLEKRLFLAGLGVEHIYSSRTLDFRREILADTQGAGVDVVLNSLADEFIDASFEVLGNGGRFLEIGKRGIWTQEQVSQRRPDVGYHPYDLADLLAAGSEHVNELLQATVDEVAAGRLAPLPLRAFAAGELPAAMRFMAQARHIGKVVIAHRHHPPVRPEAGYLVTGGLGGLGLEVGRWLVAQGAARLVLAGRRPPSDRAASLIDGLVAGGADVRVVLGDVSRPDEVARMLAAVTDGGIRLGGVVHAAGVLDDGPLSSSTWERFTTVLAPKVAGAFALHAATRAMPLDFFVMFSSGAALLGPPGQSNYAAANNVLDALAHMRHAHGLPALSIDWGAWTEVGMAAELDERHRRRVADRGVGALTPHEGLAALERLLAQDAPQVAVLPIDWPKLLAQHAGDAPPPLLAELAGRGSRSRGQPAVAHAGVRAALLAASPADRLGLLAAYTRDQIARVLGLDDPQAIDPRQGLTDLGMDSLMAVELSNRLRAGLELALPSTLAFEYPTAAELIDHLAQSLFGPPEATPADDQDDRLVGARDEFDELGDLSTGELTDALLRELDDAGY